MEGEWSNLSQQDYQISPFESFSWTQKNVSWSNSACHSIAFNGGTSLSVAGLLDLQSNDYPLYRISLFVNTRLILELVYLPQNDFSDVGICLNIDNELVSLPEIETKIVGHRNWKRKSYSLDNALGKHISEIRILCIGKKEFHALIGQIAIYDIQTVPSMVTDLQYKISWDLESVFSDKPLYNITLMWQMDDTIRHCDLFEGDQWIGRSFSNVFTISKVEGSPGTHKIYRVQAVNGCFMKHLMDKSAFVEISF